MPAVFADLALAKRLATGWFASMDPGVSHPAIALWLRGVLVAAARVPVPGRLAKLDRLERVRQISKLVADAVRRGIQAHGDPAQLVGLFAEWPQAYDEKSQQRMGRRINPNGLMPMVGIDGAVAALLDVPSWSYLPGEWSGGVPKSDKGDAWDSPRSRIIRSRLRPGEFECIQPTHDAIDAVGVGAKALGLLEPRLAGTTNEPRPLGR